MKTCLCQWCCWCLCPCPCLWNVCVNGVAGAYLDKKGSGESVTRTISFLCHLQWGSNNGSEPKRNVLSCWINAMHCPVLFIQNLLFRWRHVYTALGPIFRKRSCIQIKILLLQVTKSLWSNVANRSWHISQWSFIGGWIKRRIWIYFDDGVPHTSLLGWPTLNCLTKDVFNHQVISNQLFKSMYSTIKRKLETPI